MSKKQAPESDLGQLEVVMKNRVTRVELSRADNVCEDYIIVDYMLPNGVNATAKFVGTPSKLEDILAVASDKLLYWEDEYVA